MDVYMSDAGDQEMKLQLRALDESLAESSRLNKLVELATIDPGSSLANAHACKAQASSCPAAYSGVSLEQQIPACPQSPVAAFKFLLHCSASLAWDAIEVHNLASADFVKLVRAQ